MIQKGFFYMLCINNLLHNIQFKKNVMYFLIFTSSRRILYLTIIFPAVQVRIVVSAYLNVKTKSKIKIHVNYKSN